MARIFYSMAGEGRGHAARVRTLVEHLRHDHELWLFAPDEAYDFLARFYGPDSPHAEVRLLRIPGLRFHYTNGRLDLFKSVAAGLHYATREMPRLVTAFRRRINAERPDLVIADFEPSLPRAAVRERVPLVSLDHQHVLAAYDLSSLSASLQRYAWLMSWIVRWCYTGQTEIIASSFYTPPLKREWKLVHQVGPMIRPEVAQAVPCDGGYILSYLRANTPDRVLQALSQSGLPVRVYGLGERAQLSNVTFCPIHQQRFVDDLAGSRAVVCAAGNQLLGESLYLGKPVLAIPESQHHEQLINAHFLERMGAGMSVTLDDFHESAPAPIPGPCAGTLWPARRHARRADDPSRCSRPYGNARGITANVNGAANVTLEFVGR
jgi:uncharacterized protein (TIGR00661 family)